MTMLQIMGNTTGKVQLNLYVEPEFAKELKETGNQYQMTRTEAAMDILKTFLEGWVTVQEAKLAAGKSVVGQIKELYSQRPKPPLRKGRSVASEADAPGKKKSR